MILDCNRYRLNVSLIKHHFDSKFHSDLVSSTGLLALSTGVHIIIVAHYVGELYGFTEELDAYIGRLLKYYVEVTEVLNFKRALTDESCRYIND